MKIDFKGVENRSLKIQPLINYLENSSDFQNWEYMGLVVEIDPTIDLNNDNVLIRWTDKNEGFNDKIIVYSLEQYKTLFKEVHA